MSEAARHVNPSTSSRSSGARSRSQSRSPGDAGDYLAALRRKPQRRQTAASPVKPGDWVSWKCDSPTITKLQHHFPQMKKEDLKDEGRQSAR